MNPIPDSRHPNSPLVEVVCEIRFPGETAIECRRHEFQDAVREHYPLLLVPLPKMESATALQPYRFERKDHAAGLMLSLNRLGYYSRRYPGYETFREEFLKWSEVLGSLFRIDQITRFGLRHVNVIPFARENGFVPFEYFFDVGGILGRFFGAPFENVTFAFVLPTQGGKITTRIDTITRMDGPQEAFLLDFDFAIDSNLQFSELVACMDEAHDQSARLFKRLTTDSYRAYIKGEEIG